MSLGYPSVTDPLGTLTQGGRIFISLHSYMDYNQYSSSWNNATADALASQYYQAVVAGVVGQSTWDRPGPQHAVLLEAEVEVRPGLAVVVQDEPAWRVAHGVILSRPALPTPDGREAVVPGSSSYSSAE
jgi:hypothetical protein